MSVRKTRIPDIPDPGDKTHGLAVKEALDVLLRRRGDLLDAAVTFRDLKDGGIADVVVTGGAGRSSGSGSGGPNASPIFLHPTPPGTNGPPTGHLNIRTRSVWDGIMVLWDWPTGLVEYAYTEIWAAKRIDPLVIPTFDANAILVGTSAGAVFVHQNLGLGVTWYYWLRYIGYPLPSDPNGPPQTSLYTPATSGRGVVGTTAADPSYVLGVLEGMIAEDQLAIGLGNRINLVDFYYDTAGNLVPVPLVDVLNANGSPTGLRVQNVRNQVLLALRDVESDFQVAIAQEAAIRISEDDTIAASYAVKADIDGYITGFGFIATRRPGDPLDDPPNPTFDSSFVIRANRFAVVHPSQPGSTLPEVVPFIIGTVDGVPTVGINGQLVVDGTLLARAIQAETIGAREINATSVWAGIVTANRVFSSQFATRGDLSTRLEINGDGTQGSNFPLWFGKGPTGGSDTVFTFLVDQNGVGSLRLSGDLEVAGTGRFSTAGGVGSNRVEIGGNDNFLMWAGSGFRNTDNAKFYFDRNGNLFIRGNPVTLPVGSSATNGSPQTTLTVIAVPGRSTVPVVVMGRATVTTGVSGFEKTTRTEFLANGVVRQTYWTNVTDYVFSNMEIAVLDLPPGTYNFEMRVTITATAGNRPIPTVLYDSSSMVAIQLVAVS